MIAKPLLGCRIVPRTGPASGDRRNDREHRTRPDPLLFLAGRPNITAVQKQVHVRPLRSVVRHQSTRQQRLEPRKAGESFGEGVRLESYLAFSTGMSCQRCGDSNDQLWHATSPAGLSVAAWSDESISQAVRAPARPDRTETAAYTSPGSPFCRSRLDGRGVRSGCE